MRWSHHEGERLLHQLCVDVSQRLHVDSLKSLSGADDSDEDYSVNTEVRQDGRSLHLILLLIVSDFQLQTC